MSYNKLNYHLWKPESEVSILFYSIRNLEKLNGCENIISELTKKLEALFVDAPEKECAKELDGFIYYDNGMIKIKGEGAVVVASPWLSTTTIKEPKKITRKHKHSFLHLKLRYTKQSWRQQRLGENIYYQMRLFNKSSMPYNNIKVDFVSFLKKIEVYTMLTEEERKLADIQFPNVHNIYWHLEKLLREGYYLSDDQCKDIMMIYDTFPDKDDGGYRSNELKNSCDKYMNSTAFCNVGINFNNLNNHISNLRPLSDLERQEIIDCSVKTYKALYDVKETNMRTLLLKLGIIEEGYIPFANSTETTKEVSKVVTEE